MGNRNPFRISIDKKNPVSPGFFQTEIPLGGKITFQRPAIDNRAFGFG